MDVHVRINNPCSVMIKMNRCTQWEKYPVWLFHCFTSSLFFLSPSLCPSWQLFIVVVWNFELYMIPLALLLLLAWNYVLIASGKDSRQRDVVSEPALSLQPRLSLLETHLLFPFIIVKEPPQQQLGTLNIVNLFLFFFQIMITLNIEHLLLNY